MKQYDNFKIKKPYYDGTKLLSLLDRNKEKPEIYISTSNRSAGKSTFFNGYITHRFLQYGEKPLLLFRNKYEVENAKESFFPSVENLFFPELEMLQEQGIENTFYNLYLKVKNSDTCVHFGYATALSASDQIKRYSNMLNDASCILFDEFIPESGKYLKNEIAKLMSIHDSVARGNGSQCRYLPVYLIGNLIDINNPYYDALDIMNELDINTNYLRGNGFVLEQGFNESSALSHKKSAFHKAFSNEKYNKASQEKEYINTNYNMIEKLPLNSGQYLFTLCHNNKFFSCRYIDDLSIFYISENPDKNNKLSFACTKNDIKDNCIYDIENNFVYLMKKKFYNGNVRFSSFKSREAFLLFIHN